MPIFKNYIIQKLNYPLITILLTEVLVYITFEMRSSFTNYDTCCNCYIKIGSYLSTALIRCSVAEKLGLNTLTWKAR